MSHRTIGRLREFSRVGDACIVDFPKHPNWRGSLSELQCVSRASEVARVGDRVRPRTPAAAGDGMRGWPAGTDIDAVGELTSIEATADREVGVVSFADDEGARDTWRCDLSELLPVSDDGKPLPPRPPPTDATTDPLASLRAAGAGSSAALPTAQLGALLGTIAAASAAVGPARPEIRSNSPNTSPGTSPGGVTARGGAHAVARRVSAIARGFLPLFVFTSVLGLFLSAAAGPRYSPRYSPRSAGDHRDDRRHNNRSVRHGARRSAQYSARHPPMRHRRQRRHGRARARGGWYARLGGRRFEARVGGAVRVRAAPAVGDLLVVDPRQPVRAAYHRLTTARLHRRVIGPIILIIYDAQSYTMPNHIRSYHILAAQSYTIISYTRSPIIYAQSPITAAGYP